PVRCGLAAQARALTDLSKVTSHGARGDGLVEPGVLGVDDAHAEELWRRKQPGVKGSYVQPIPCEEVGQGVGERHHPGVVALAVSTDVFVAARIARTSIRVRTGKVWREEGGYRGFIHREAVQFNAW
ncbi:MAG: hypothetical protein ACI9MC_003636, partial [Kiritimatiellia bacterium]